MSVPVLVIHGVANRDQKAFEATVQDLQNRAGKVYQLIPVWWADLGAKTENLNDTLPDMGGVTVREETTAGIDADAFRELMRAAIVSGSGQEVRGDGEKQEIVIRAAQGSSTEVRADNEVAEAIRDAWPQTIFLKLVKDEAVLQAIGRAIGAAAGDAAGSDEDGQPSLTRDSGDGDIWGGDSVDTRSKIGDRIRKVTDAILKEMDKVVGGVVGQVLGDVNQSFRAAWAASFSCFMGDIFAYQRRQPEVQARLSQAVADHAPGWGGEGKPISVLAHSLGGVIAFDAATRSVSPLWIDGFVTFGSQSSFFEVTDPRPSLTPYGAGSPIRLPATIARWTNLWEPLDFLAFAAAKVFRLHSGLMPVDIRIAHDNRYGLYTHSAYWGAAELVTAVQQTVKP